MARDPHVQALSAALQRPISVHYHHRRDLPIVWQQVHGGRPLPDLPPYAFRAFATNDNVHLFVDATETYESALWLLAHELAHTGVADSRLLRTALRAWSERDPDYLSSDEAHEADPEEQLANHVADRTMTRLGLPTGQNRPWWRKRVNRLRR